MARDQAPAGIVVEIVDLRSIPFYDGDVEATGDPPAVSAFKARILAADALLMATPEYNGAVPGLLQNAIDWASRPRGSAALGEKLVAVTGATPGGGGTTRAQHSLRQTLVNAGARVLPLPELLVPHATDRLGSSGPPTDLALADDLRQILVSLRATAEAGRREESRAA